MKNIFVICLVSLFVGGACYAQEQTKSDFLSFSLVGMRDKRVSDRILNGVNQPNWFRYITFRSILSPVEKSTTEAFLEFFNARYSYYFQDHNAHEKVLENSQSFAGYTVTFLSTACSLNSSKASESVDLVNDFLKNISNINPHSEDLNLVSDYTIEDQLYFVALFLDNFYSLLRKNTVTDTTRESLDPMAFQLLSATVLSWPHGNFVINYFNSSIDNCLGIHALSNQN